MNTLPFLQRGKLGGIRFEKRKKVSSQILLYFYLLFISVFFIVLALRLFQLTIVRGDYFKRLSEQNRIRELLIEPRRGEILDRKGFLIAKSLPADVKKNENRITSSRTFSEPETIAHLIGYRQKADQADLKNDNCLYKLKLGDKVGKKGIEKLFECDLRGRHGKKLVEIDAKGNFVRTLSLVAPQDGKTLNLAFDSDLQKKAYELIKDKKAAVIGLQPNTGEVLIFVSSPSFNSQDFEDENETATSVFVKNEKEPLFNRATEAVYPPGSIFKLVVAAAALEEKAIKKDTLIEDTGTIKAGPLTFGNWYFLQYGKTEGMVDIIKAIRRSNDIFFYKTGVLTTPEKMRLWAETLGFSQKTGIGFEEAEGLIPSEFWKEEVIKDRWYLGDTYNLSIGQGYILVTPLQVAQATQVFANGGYLCQPELLKMTPSKAGSSNCKKLPISSKTLSLIREGMKEACSPGGTGWPLFDFKPQTACKTGTAESHAESKIPHAWFTVFAPFDKTEIVLTVLVEEGGQGSDVAAPIAKEILKAYFERKE